MSWARLWAFVWLLLGTSALPAGSRIAPAGPSREADRDECPSSNSAPANQPPADSDKKDKARELSCGPQVDVWDGPATRIASAGPGKALTPAMVGARADHPPCPKEGDRPSFPARNFLIGQTARCWLACRYPHAPPVPA